MNRALLGLGLLLPFAAPAWESVCVRYADPALQPSELLAAGGAACAPSAGPNAARQRWVGGLDEHRRVYELSREEAGLPEEVSRTSTLNVFGGLSPVRVGTVDEASWQPVPFDQASRIVWRHFTAGELAQLPDFSYALWDWALANETCPLDGATPDAELCHDFASHMGPVNSNHFVPQAQAFYAHYHQLALARAAECAALGTKLAGTGGRFADFLKACELQALAIEAVGQHFLQDAWSMGHMWQRWGSPNLGDFEGATADDQRDRAVLVALTSGFLHGARGVLQVLPSWAGLDVNDAMCAPWDDVAFVRPDGSVHRGMGDDYLAQLPPFKAWPEYDAQSVAFRSCAASGLAEVYAAAGQQHGAAGAPAAGILSVDPLGPGCFGQRATNAALLRGAAIQLKLVGGQVTLPLDSRVVAWMVPKVARAQGKVPVAPALRNQFRLGLQRVVSVVRVLAAQSPEGTEAAEGRMGALLGAQPNGAYAQASPLAGYLDPPLPWRPGVGAGDAAVRATGLARVFHRAHVGDWCAALGDAELQALKAHTQDGTLDAEGQTAACTSCQELAVRHLRVGAPGAYDTALEPVCHYLAASPAYVYHPQVGTEDVGTLAWRWCGCTP